MTRLPLLTIFKHICFVVEGIPNLNQVWKTLNKIYPKTQTKIPIAKKNHQGKTISEPKQLKNTNID